MPPIRSSDSLKAVLLSAKSASGSGSKHGSSGLTWHSLRSVGPSGGGVDPPGHYFPSKLALAMGLIKLFFSILMIGLGAVAIVMRASISSIGAGVWVGTIVGVSGFLGVCAARRPYIHVYVISFMSVSILSLAASGLLIVLSATAWAKDNQVPQILLYDQETESEVDLFGDFLIRKPSILVSGLLVVLGVFDILISLACVALSAREACGAGSAQMGVFATHDGHDKKERLYRWLGQQKNLFQGTNSNGQKNITSVSQFVPLTSSVDTSPLRKQTSPLTSTSSDPLQLIPQKLSPGGSSGTSSDAIDKKTSKSSSGATSGHKNSSVIFLHPEVDYDLSEPILLKKKNKPKPHPSPNHVSLPPLMPVEIQPPPRRKAKKHEQYNQYPYHQYVPLYAQDTYIKGNPQQGFHSLGCPQHQVYAQYPPLYYSQLPAGTHFPMIENLKEERERIKINKRNQKRRQKEKKKRREEKRKRREARERRKNEPLTDDKIERSYTGLDREIAEGFISLTMEPFASKRKFNRSPSDNHLF